MYLGVNVADCLLRGARIPIIPAKWCCFIDSCDVIINSYAGKPVPIPAQDCENNALNFTVGTYQSKGQGTGEHEWDKWDVFDHCQGLPNDDWQ